MSGEALHEKTHGKTVKSPKAEAELGAHIRLPVKIGKRTFIPGIADVRVHRSINIVQVEKSQPDPGFSPDRKPKRGAREGRLPSLDAVEGIPLETVQSPSEEIVEAVDRAVDMPQGEG